MNRNYSTTITPSRERGQHLKFEDRVSIKIYRRFKYTLRAIAEALGCSPSTIMYELGRCTGKRKGSRGRFPEYSAKRGQANYEMNRSLCHRKAKALNGNPFVDWVVDEVLNKKGSIDSCVGSAKLLNKYPQEYMVCTKTIYNAVWSGNIKLTPFGLPEALSRQNKKNR